MALKFTTTKQQANCVKALVYGDAGAGKTKLCATAPTPVILSAESGLLSLADYDIPVIEISTAQDCFDALAFLQSSPEAQHFETICLDSITDIAEVMLTDYKRQNSDARQAYGLLADDMGSLIRAFRDLPNKHVYFTAKMGSMNDDYSGLLKYLPSMPGKNLTQGLPFFFDEVMVLRIHEGENGESWRYLQTNLDMQFIAKDRSGKLAKVEEPNLTNLFDKILGKSGVKEPIEKEVINEEVKEQECDVAKLHSEEVPIAE